MKFETITTKEQFEQWQAYAKTFDHDTDKPMMPIVTITDGDRMIGHFHELQHPVVFPAFHPSISPRQFRDSVEAIANYYCIKSMGGQYPNGVLFTALPRQLPVDHSQKMGFEELGVNLYRRVP